MADHSLHTPEGRSDAFAKFRSQPYYRFMTKLRQRRAEQIRALFTDPQALSLDRFNHEIWQLGGRVLLRGQPIADKIFDGMPSPKRLAELSDALDAGELEVEGNSMWRPASSVYGSTLKENDAAKVARIRHAFVILTNRGLAPFEQVKKVDACLGYSPGFDSMLVMIAHPTGWALDNSQSRGGLRRLGFVVNTSTEVQVTVSQLRETLGASDLIELDLFLSMLNQRPKPNADGPRIWWVNQGQSYEQEKELGCIKAGTEGADGRSVPARSAVAEVCPGDIIIHHSRKYIRAVSHVQDEPQLLALLNGTQQHQARTVYHELRTPIPSADLGATIYALNLPAGPFGKDFFPKQGYLHELTKAGLQCVYEQSPTNNWPTYVTAFFTTPRDVTQPPATVSVPPTPPVPPFAAVLEALDQKRLSFPPELVSTYLLALQAKGFVILTGISGTGKTQLALEVARHFQPIQRLTITAKPPDGARALTVKAYTVQNSQMIVPVDVIEELGLSTDAERNRTLTVHYPGGSSRLSLYKYPGHDTFMLRLHDQLKIWFRSNFHVGDTFFLEVLPATDSDAAALRFSKPMTMEQERRLENVRVFAVRPDWTDAHGLLGYFNPLTRRYESTPFLRFLLEAERETTQARAEGREPNPYFVVLDEMNLARVEYYFADFLSCLESGEALELHDDRELESGVGTEAEQTVVPRRLMVPRNLFFTGTVNVDETTTMFSPKVLDRAFTIEFNHVDLRGLGTTTTTDGIIPLALIALPERLLQPGTITSAEWVVFGEREGGALADVVMALNDVLARDQRQFGYRVANEIARFVNLAADQATGTLAALWAALDLAILAKALPKLAGTQQELEDLLMRLFTFALSGLAGDTTLDADAILTQWRDQGGQIVTEPMITPPRTARLPRTAAKLWRMVRRLRQQGFTAFVC